MAGATLQPAQSLRILSIDGGGIKGYTALLILRRIIRSMMSEGGLDREPRPCEIFDLIAGTSTGGIIAVMLGRLHMTIDECITAYETAGKRIFGRGGPVGGQVGKLFAGLASSAFFDVGVLQKEMREVLVARGLPKNAAFLEAQPMCKVMLCVTRKATSRPDLLRNFKSLHPTEENYSCYVWEAASATAAAPMYFQSVKFEQSGVEWSDGGMRRNNPINEAMAEIAREKDWKGKRIGCIVSIGTGVPRMKAVSTNLAKFLRHSVDIMTDSEDTAAQFAASTEGRELAKSRRYFRFSVPYGMSEIQLEDYKETEKMSALTTEYLRSVESGNQVESCANSLLDPDTNLQINNLYKPYMLPSNTCTHFVERPRYAQRLQAYYTPKLQRQQIFVLWGLGGIGKTQIALSFAHDITDRLSVFWLRGGSFMTFAADYAAIPAHLGSNLKLETKMEEIDQQKKLSQARTVLQECSQKWLLVLDNADDLDQFRGGSGQAMSIADLLPRGGRILITTRDERFVGAVSKAHDAQRVLPMNEVEAMDLLLRSLPPNLARQDHSSTLTAATELLDELGNLPLAIAQAAANIKDRQTSLVNYVGMYREKKRRIELMKEPVWDFQNTDRSTHSIHITWELSFEHLKDNYPLSALCLSYLGFFHYRDVPQSILIHLPEFERMEEDEFQGIMKHLLRLALVDRTEESDGVVGYSMHPLVHQKTITRLSPDEVISYLGNCSNLIAVVFPFLIDVTDSSVDTFMAQYLVVHALHQIDIVEEVGYSSKAIARLTQCVASYAIAIGLTSLGVHLAKKAADMAPMVWGQQDLFNLYVTDTLCRALTEAATYPEAEASSQAALSDGLNTFRDQLSEDEAGERQLAFENYLGTALWGQKKYSELLLLRQGQIQNRLVLRDSRRVAYVKHNIAHALHHTGQHERARQMNDELLALAGTAAGKEVISDGLRLIMMNLRLSILDATSSKPSGPSETADRAAILGTRESLYQQSRQFHGICHVDTWKSLNNLLNECVTCDKTDKAIEYLQDMLSACLSTVLTIEGQFAETFSYTYSHFVAMIIFLNSCDRTQDSEHLQALMEACIKHVDASFAGFKPRMIADSLNTYGVHLQWNGRYEEAEGIHRTAFELEQARCQPDVTKPDFIAERPSLLDVILYNTMLALARQGLFSEATSFRDQHEQEIVHAEAVHGQLRIRLERDAYEKSIYDEASRRMRQGAIQKGDIWWQSNQAVLDKTERRYGKLAHQIGGDIMVKATGRRKLLSWRWLHPSLRKLETPTP